MKKKFGRQHNLCGKRKKSAIRKSKLNAKMGRKTIESNEMGCWSWLPSEMWKTHVCRLQWIYDVDDANRRNKRMQKRMNTIKKEDEENEKQIKRSDEIEDTERNGWKLRITRRSVDRSQKSTSQNEQKKKKKKWWMQNHTLQDEPTIV